MSIDTESAKRLLQSTDIQELQTAAIEWKEYCNNNNANGTDVDVQILKLRILLNSRIVQIVSQDDTIALSNAYRELGCVWMELGDSTRALGQLTKSLSYDTDNVQTIVKISDAYKHTSDFENAITNMERAIEIQEAVGINIETTPGICTAYSKLAEIFESKADFNQALAVLEKAKNIFRQVYDNDDDSNNNTIVQARATVYSHLGSVQEKMGQYKDAVSSLTTAVTAMNQCYGEDHPKTQEIAYLLEMACSFV